MTNDTIEVHFKGAGITLDAKFEPGIPAEVEKAEKVARFILDLVGEEPSTASAGARKTKRTRAGATPEALAPTDPEAESL